MYYYKIYILFSTDKLSFNYDDQAKFKVQYIYIYIQYISQYKVSPPN